jgi:hemerythrin-like domain-containing protein
MKQSSIEIIRNEHRSIAAVLDGLRYLARDLQTHPAQADADFRAIRAMLHYLDAFPARYHHPKEDRYLFAAIRGATHDADVALTSLQDDHAQNEDRMLRIMRETIRAECQPARHLAEFVGTIEAFVADYWRHMSLEEDTVFPLALEVLGPTDWKRIDAAFQGNSDPLVGAEAGKEFDKLLSRVVNLAPEPIGLGSG